MTLPASWDLSRTQDQTDTPPTTDVAILIPQGAGAAPTTITLAHLAEVLGDLRHWRGVWSGDGRRYVVNDIVVHAERLWACNTSHLSSEHSAPHTTTGASVWTPVDNVAVNQAALANAHAQAAAATAHGAQLVATAAQDDADTARGEAANAHSAATRAQSTANQAQASADQALARRLVRQLTPDTVSIRYGSGSDFQGPSLPPATEDQAGLMSRAQVSKLNGIPAGGVDPSGNITAAQIVTLLEGLTGDDRLDYSALDDTPTIPSLRTGAETARLLDALTGDDRLDYESLKNRPLVPQQFSPQGNWVNGYTYTPGQVVRHFTSLGYEVLAYCRVEHTATLGNAPTEDNSTQWFTLMAVPQSDWASVSTGGLEFIKNKPNLHEPRSLNANGYRVDPSDGHNSAEFRLLSPVLSPTALPAGTLFSAYHAANTGQSIVHTWQQWPPASAFPQVSLGAASQGWRMLVDDWQIGQALPTRASTLLGRDLNTGNLAWLEGDGQSVHPFHILYLP